MKAYPAIAAITHKSPGATLVYHKHEVDRVISTYRKEQSNMRAHLQKWHRIFIEVDNNMITPVQCKKAMEALWEVNPYD